MKIIIAVIAALFTIVQSASAQFNDDFSDGDFTYNPQWQGDTGDFVVNSNRQLQSNATVANSTFMLVTKSTIAKTAQWEFYVNLDFKTSSRNYVDVYVTASLADLKATSNAGYFVRIGNTNEQVSLYIKNSDGSERVLVDGMHGVVKQGRGIKVKVICNKDFLWTLMTDVSGTGTAYAIEGSITDATYDRSSYFGILIKQSTASFFKKHYFDDFIVNEMDAPVKAQINWIHPRSGHLLDVKLNVAVNAISAENVANYNLDNAIGNPSTSNKDNADPTLIHLDFAKPFPNNTLLSLTLEHLMDASGNNLQTLSGQVFYHVIKQYDLIIDEIMADPRPPVGLPDAEWIEIKNNSGFPIDLSGWKVGKTGKVSGEAMGPILQADSFAIFCKRNVAPMLSAYGVVIPFDNFPILKNNSDVIYLLSPDDKIVHSVDYSTVWYRDKIKSKGGWSLEMIDTKSVCDGKENWIASNDVSGGTPGRRNSVEGLSYSHSALKLLSVFAMDKRHLMLQFNKSLDSQKVLNKAQFEFSDNNLVTQMTVQQPLFNSVLLTLQQDLIAGKIYTLNVSGIEDCAGSMIENKKSIRFGLATHCDSFDVVINEILFDPKPGGAAYVELYNRSNKILDLKTLALGKRNQVNNIIERSNIVPNDKLFFPGDYVLLTRDTSIVLHDYYTLDREAFIEMDKFITMAKDTGNIVLLNEGDHIIDDVAYSAKWQFDLLNNTQGVALERIDYNNASDSTNFHSASSAVGYGTPGYKNSQSCLPNSAGISVTVTPEIISPDFDGVDDIATISLQFPHSGFVSVISIYDMAGREVRRVERNGLNGSADMYLWDGFGENHVALPVGIYIIVTDVLDTSSGRRHRFKNVITLARRN